MKATYSGFLFPSLKLSKYAQIENGYLKNGGLSRKSVREYSDLFQ